MDIAALRNVTSEAVKQAADQSVIGQRLLSGQDQSFGSIFDKAMENISATNSYISDAENEEIRWALGETQNTHELAAALGKATTALQYTVAIRDRFLESYKELMQMQI